MNDTPVLWEETVQGGATWSHVLKRGTALRLTDIEGGANAGALFYNFECPVERYNMADTLKAQHVARLTSGLVLYSDMGRVLCSVTGDTTGWHDPIGGCSNSAMVRAKYGEGRYQECRNAYYKNALDSFLVELGKWGLGPRDLDAKCKLLQPRHGGGGWRHAMGGGQLAAGRQRGTARRDERAGDPEHVPASAGPQPKICAQAGATLDTPRAGGGTGRSLPSLAAGERARVHPDGKVLPLRTQMSGTRIVESQLNAANAVYSEEIPAGEPWIHEIRQGQTFRIVDLRGNQAVDTLFYNAHDYSDRYSAQDTIREQRNIYLTTGTRLISTRGTVLLTITADTCGRHDTLGGACANESNMVRYAIDKRHMHACRSSFLKGLIDWGRGMEKRDITSNINFFMNVPVTAEGKLTFEDGISQPGKYVEMRAEIDVLAAISNCPQLNNPCNAYDPTPVQVLIWPPAEN